MELTKTNLVYYLLDAQIITPASVVDGDFTVVEVSRRNRDFMVVCKHSPGVFLKQDRRLVQQDSSPLYYEAFLYQMAHSTGEFKALASLMPSFHSYDAEHTVLIIELLSGGEDLYAYHMRQQRFSPDVAEQLGSALGRLHHDVSPAIRASRKQAHIASSVPWIFSFYHSPVYPAEYLSDGNIQMLEIVQSYPEFRRALEQLSPLWQTDTFIHNDIRLENCILCPSNDAEGGAVLKLVDWEMATFGDPLWDVGGVFQAYLVLAIRAMQSEDDPPSAPQDTHPVLTFSDMQPSIRRFWETYEQTVGMEPGKVDQALERSVLFAGVRLIQTAFEQTQRLPHLSPDAVYQLQASSNLLKEPQNGIEQLLGV